MDYKTFIRDFDGDKKSLVDFINLRNKRNVERSEEMVEDYVKAMNEGDYSIKSYKAKIIHNELDCNHAIRDVEAVKEKTIQKLNDLIDAYFEEYLDNRIDESLPKDKVRDMRDFLQRNRRQMHEVLQKKNNIDKDFELKTKELEIEKKEKLNSYNEKSQSLKNKLLNDLKKQNEKTIKEYSPFEQEMLDCNDKKHINELKEKIKEIRKTSLDEEYEIKMSAYDEILNEDLTFTKSYQEFIYQLEKYRKETQEKSFELELENNLLNVESDYRDKLYDVKHDDKANERFLEEIKNYEALVKEHNAILCEDYSAIDRTYSVKEKMFVYDLAKLHLYRLLVNVHKNNRYDQFGNFLIHLVDLVNQECASYQEMVDNITPHHEKEANALKEALNLFVSNPKKKLTKEELETNVLESLDRYYDNYLKEIDYYNKVYSDLLYNIVKKLNEDYYTITKEEKPTLLVLDDVTNYNYVDLSNYGYKKEREEEVVEVHQTTENGEVTVKTDQIYMAP